MTECICLGLCMLFMDLVVMGCVLRVGDECVADDEDEELCCEEGDDTVAPLCDCE